MMRINLLGIEKQTFRAPAEFTPAKQGLTLGAALLVAALAVGIPYRILSGQIAGIQVELEEERAEERRLAGIKAQIMQYQAQQQQLNSRINTINQLRRSQTGPVQLLNMLGVVVNQTPNLWIRTMRRQGPRVLLNGEASSVDQIADFIENLKKTGLFVDVQMRESFQDNVAENVVRFKFNLDCLWRPVGPPQPAAPAAAPKAAG